MRNEPLVFDRSERIVCNSCGRDATQSVHAIPRLVRCVACGLTYVNPRPLATELTSRYAAGYFHCSEPVLGGYEDYDGDSINIQRTFRRRMSDLAARVDSATPRHLDVGCATGLFLDVSRAAGWHSEGSDLSAHAVDRARQRGFAVTCGFLPDVGYPDHSFDVVTMWDVIEHDPNPAALLRECHRILAPGGILALSTPDAGSLPARILRGNWLGFRSIDEHLFFFSRLTLRDMLHRAGFAVLDTRSVGKYLTLPRIIARLRYYTRVGAVLLRGIDRMLPEVSIYVNPLDTMQIIAGTRDPAPFRDHDNSG